MYVLLISLRVVGEDGFDIPDAGREGWFDIPEAGREGWGTWSRAGNCGPGATDGSDAGL